jgi:hypothetical protein
MLKNDEEKQLSGSHSSMLRTEVRGCHRLPDREIASGSFGTSVSQRDLKVALVGSNLPLLNLILSGESRTMYHGYVELFL